MKILAIDFNIIMYNCIKLYADKVNINENSTLVWEMLQDEMEIKQHINVDAKVIKKIIALLKANQSAKIALLDNQSAIVKDINDEDKVEITNIDFFHDLLYSEKDIEKWKKDKYDDLNWLGYLLYKDKVEKCTWIKMPNSYRCTNNIENDVEIINFSNIDINLMNDFDKIYFSFSPYYIPYEYKYLYDMIAEFIKEDEE